MASIAVGRSITLKYTRAITTECKWLDTEGAQPYHECHFPLHSSNGASSPQALLTLLRWCGVGQGAWGGRGVDGTAWRAYEWVLSAAGLQREQWQDLTQGPSSPEEVRSLAQLSCRVRNVNFMTSLKKKSSHCRYFIVWNDSYCNKKQNHKNQMKNSKWIVYSMSLQPHLSTGVPGPLPLTVWALSYSEKLSYTAILLDFDVTSCVAWHSPLLYVPRSIYFQKLWKDWTSLFW